MNMYLLMYILTQLHGLLIFSVCNSIDCGSRRLGKSNPLVIGIIYRK